MYNILPSAFVFRMQTIKFVYKMRGINCHLASFCVCVCVKDCHFAFNFLSLRQSDCFSVDYYQSNTIHKDFVFANPLIPII